MEIFKLQRPITGTFMNKVLVYNKDRSKSGMIETDEETMGLIFGSEHKVFYLCEIVKGELILGKRTKDPGW